MPTKMEVTINEIMQDGIFSRGIVNETKLFIDGVPFDARYRKASEYYHVQQYMDARAKKIPQKDIKLKDYTKEEVLATALAMGRRVAYYPVDEKTGEITAEPVEYSLPKGFVLPEEWKQRNEIMKFSTSSAEKMADQYRKMEEDNLKLEGQIKSIKESSYYKKVEEIGKGVWGYLGPINQAMYGEYGKKEYTNGMNLFAPNLPEDKSGKEDLSRSGILYGIACLISEGHSIDDIFDPEKLLEQKKAAGDRMIRLSRENNMEEIIKIYIEATEKILDYLSVEVKDDLFENMRDYKALALRKALFDMNQTFGSNRELLEKGIKEKYKDAALQHLENIYNGALYVQDLSGTEMDVLSVLNDSNLEKSHIAVQMAAVETWERKKDIVKTIGKRELKKPEIDQLRGEYIMENMAIREELNQEDVQPLDLIPVISQIENDYQGYCRNLVGKQLEDAFGKDAAEANFMDPSYRIYINGRSMEAHISGKDKSAENYRDILNVKITEALLAGKRVTLFPRNESTYVTETEPVVLDLKIPPVVKDVLSRKVPKGRITKEAPVSEENAKANENIYIKNLKTMEKIFFSPGFQTLSDIRYKNNLLGAAIAGSVFGEKGTREVRTDDALNFMPTRISDMGVFRFERSGVALGAAVLLARGMTLEEIMNPDVKTEEKLAAGNYLQELAAKGDEGRREMALMAATAMEKLYEGKHIRMSADLWENTADFEVNFASQIMFELNQETQGSVLNLKDAYLHKYSQENPSLSPEELEKEAEKAYEKAQSYVAPYQLVKRVNAVTDPLNISKNESAPDLWAASFLAKAHEVQTNKDIYFDDNLYQLEQTDQKVMLISQYSAQNPIVFNTMAQAAGVDTVTLLTECGGLDNMQANTSLRFQYQALKHIAEDIEAADPMYLRSSSQFREMKATVKELLEHYQQGMENCTPQWHETLEKKYHKLISCNSEYLEMKKGKEMSPGSNGEKRLNIAKRVNEFSLQAGKLIQQRADVQLGSKLEMMKQETDRLSAEIANYEPRFCQMYHPVAKPADEKLTGKEKKFMTEVLAVKDPKNDITEQAGFTAEDISLFMLLGRGTFDVCCDMKGKKMDGCDAVYETEEDIRNYQLMGTTSINEDLFELRDGTDKRHMGLIEHSRANIKEALEEYAKGNPNRLGNIIGEGLKSFVCTFATFESGIKSGTGERKALVNLNRAAAVYDMLKSKPQLLEVLTNLTPEENRLTRETLETYRGGKVSYQICKNALEAKQTLLSQDPFKRNTPEEREKLKLALADLTLKNILHQEMVQNYNRQVDSVLETANEAASQAAPEKFTFVAGAETLKMKMSKTQRNLSPEKLEAYREKLKNSKTIDMMSRNMTMGNLTEMLSRETEVFMGVANRIMKKEAKVFQDKEIHLENVVEKAKTKEEISFMMDM